MTDRYITYINRMYIDLNIVCYTNVKPHIWVWKSSQPIIVGTYRHKGLFNNSQTCAMFLFLGCYHVSVKNLTIHLCFPRTAISLSVEDDGWTMASTSCQWWCSCWTSLILPRVHLLSSHQPWWRTSSTKWVTPCTLCSLAHVTSMLLVRHMHVSKHLTWVNLTNIWFCLQSTNMNYLLGGAATGTNRF